MKVHATPRRKKEMAKPEIVSDISTDIEQEALANLKEMRKAMKRMAQQMRDQAADDDDEDEPKKGKKRKTSMIGIESPNANLLTGAGIGAVIGVGVTVIGAKSGWWLTGG